MTNKSEIDKINHTLQRMNGRIQANQNNDTLYRNRLSNDIKALYWCVAALCFGLVVLSLTLVGML